MGVRLVSMRPAGTRQPPIGGANGSWRHRLLSVHAPIAFVSAALLLLFMALPAFEPLAYVGMEMDSRSVLPQPADMTSARPERPQEGASDHGSGRASTPSSHGAGQAPSSGHGASPAPAPSGHAGSSGMPPADHAGQSGGPAEPLTAERARSRFEQRLTVATGYIATLLLAFTLLIGPANLLLRRRNPISSYLRRDAGMWTAGSSVVHVIVGLQVHSGGQLSGYLAYFFGRDGSLLLNSFGIANWIGLVATVIVVGLLTISSDLALRTLNAPRWKWLQRLNYALFALVVAHAIFYGALLRVNSPFTMLLVLGVTAVLAGQTLGIYLWRRRRVA